MLSAARGLLLQLGVSDRYKGFRYAARAAALWAADPDRYQLTTKWLYPEIAKRYAVGWPSVERDLRTVIKVAWTRSPARLVQLSRGALADRPTCAQFISILAANLPRPPDGDGAAQS